MSEEATLLELRLGDRAFCIACELVVEVLPMLPFKQLPGAPPVIQGVASVRGVLLPLIDPRIRLGLPGANPTVHSNIVAIQAAGLMAGLVVDSAEEVFRVPWSEVCKPGALEPKVPYGMGLVKRGQRDLILVDLDALVSHDEWVGLKHATDADT